MGDVCNILVLFLWFTGWQDTFVSGTDNDERGTNVVLHFFFGVLGKRKTLQMQLQNMSSFYQEHRRQTSVPRNSDAL